MLILDFDKLYDTKEDYAGFSYENFSLSFYSMIVTVSTTNFPMSMVAAYKQSRLSVFFYLLNTFTLNIIMFNLILASFYFYYQSFYCSSVRKLNSKKNLV